MCALYTEDGGHRPHSSGCKLWWWKVLLGLGMRRLTLWSWWEALPQIFVLSGAGPWGAAWPPPPGIFGHMSAQATGVVSLFWFALAPRPGQGATHPHPIWRLAPLPSCASYHVTASRGQVAQLPPAGVAPWPSWRAGGPPWDPSGM
jgi:hypothetical protein